MTKQPEPVTPEDQPKRVSKPKPKPVPWRVKRQLPPTSV